MFKITIELNQFDNNNYLDQHKEEQWTKTHAISTESKEDYITILKRNNISSQQLYYLPDVKLSGDFEIEIELKSDNGTYISYMFNTTPTYSKTTFGWRNIEKWTKLNIIRKDDKIKIFYNDSTKPQAVLTNSLDDLIFFIRFNGLKNENVLHYKNFKISANGKTLFTEYYSNNVIDYLMNEIDISKYNQSKLENKIKSYENFIDFISKDIKFEVHGALKYSQLICQEILNFVVKVCEKHKLDYWIDFGTLLGAVRHGGFVPWDDDIDLGMMRSDFNKLLDVLNDEIKLNNLENHLKIKIDVPISTGDISRTFLQVLYVDNKNRALSWIDVFAYDFCTIDIKDHENDYFSERGTFNQKILQGVSRSTVEKEMYSKLNLSYDIENYIIHGADGSLLAHKDGNINVIETNKLMPLTKIKFNNSMYNAPADYKNYLKKIYGNYSVQVVTHTHNQANLLRSRENIDDYCKYYIDLLQNANKKFK